MKTLTKTTTTTCLLSTVQTHKQIKRSHSFTDQFYFILTSLKYAWPCMLINYCIIKRLDIIPSQCYQAYSLRDLENGHAKQLSKCCKSANRRKNRNSNFPHGLFDIWLKVNCENMAINPGIPQTLFFIIHQCTRWSLGPLVNRPKTVS